MKKFYSFFILLFSLGLLATGAFVVAQSSGWTNPSSTPPLGNVAAPINTSSDPQTKLGSITFKSGVATNGYSPDSSSLVSTPSIFSGAPGGGTHINSSRIESDVPAYLAKLTSSRLGIGTTNPAAKLDVIGDASISGNIQLNNGQLFNTRLENHSGKDEALCTTELLGSVYYNTTSDEVCACRKDGWYCSPNLIPSEAKPLPPGEDKLVFVTSTTYRGALGGINGANAKCQERAQAGGLTSGGSKFRAWISVGGIDAKDNIECANNKRYMRTDGSVVAQNCDGLTSGSILSPISSNEFGSSVPSVFDNRIRDHVWTGTDDHGVRVGGTCFDWSSTSGVSGRAGGFRDTGIGWSNSGNVDCKRGKVSDGSHLPRLYCFEI